jgi:hypothetical protein
VACVPIVTCDHRASRGIHGPPAPALVPTVNSGSDGPRCAGIEGLRGSVRGSQVGDGSLLGRPAQKKTPGTAFQKHSLNRCYCSTGYCGVGVGETRGAVGVSRFVGAAVILSAKCEMLHLGSFN